MNNDTIKCINGMSISFDTVLTDNLPVAAPLAGAAILDEKLSFLIHEKEKDWNTTILIPIGIGHEFYSAQFKPSWNQIAFSRVCCLYSLNNRDFEAPHLSYKEKCAISLKDLYLSIRKDKADLFDVFGLENSPYASFNFGGTKKIPIQI